MMDDSSIIHHEFEEIGCCWKRRATRIIATPTRQAKPSTLSEEAYVKFVEIL
jgi:hypothetical protein